jgi:hypothetical protein
LSGELVGVGKIIPVDSNFGFISNVTTTVAITEIIKADISILR